MSKFNSTENKWKRTYDNRKRFAIEHLNVHEKIKRYVEDNKPLVRPPSKYDNKSREERINELIGYEGTSHD